MKETLSRKLWLPIFLLISFLGIFVRFYHYGELVVFTSDQALHLSEVKDMVDSRKLRLNGPMFQSKIVEGRGFFSGPTYYYLLAVLGIIFNWNVFFITGVFTFFWVFTFIIIFFWLKKRFGETISLTVYALLSFWTRLVPFSRFIWNPYFLPLFGALFLWLLDLKGENKIFFFLSGLSFGIAFSAHYAAFLWMPIILFVIVREIKEKRYSFYPWLSFAIGAILPQMPLVLFELRHNFYNIRTILFQLSYYQGRTFPVRTFTPVHYYLFPGIPIIGFLTGWILNKLKTTVFFKPGLFILLILLLFFLKRDLIGLGQKPTGENSWSIASQKQVADLIIKDNEKIFEVATTHNADTRAMALRWWLRMAKHEPMSVVDYDKTDVLYLIARPSRPPETETVWEVYSLRPFKIAFKRPLEDDLVFYKLARIKK